MPIWILILSIGLPAAWLVAEFKGGRAARIGLGLLAIVVFHVVLFTATQVVRGYEKDFMRSSLKEMKRLIQAGRTDVVVAAIETYQLAVTNDTPFSFQGSRALRQALRKVNTGSEASRAADERQPSSTDTNRTSGAVGSRR
jgi:hypothetical protein